MEALGSLGIAVPEILLPRKGIDLGRWAVVACDQYTSEPEYWKRVEEYVGAAPSTLRLVLPEAWLLAGDDEAARSAAIQKTMREYLAGGVFAAPRKGFVVVERQTAHVRARLGLLVALDLDCYDWRPSARALVRATEATVEDRLPARLRVREHAALELPHVLVLIDDPERTVIEPAARAARTRAPLYDTELWPNGGRVRGFALDGAAEVTALGRGLAALASPERQRAKYGGDGRAPFLFAVGDGNHSLAAAKLLWEQRKSGLSLAQRTSHPLRFALVELLNVHDPGLRFEPIHRLVFGAEPESLVRGLEQRAPGGSRRHLLRWRGAGRSGTLTLAAPSDSLLVAVFQQTLDAWLRDHPEARIDFIHGGEALARLSDKPDRTGFELPAFERADLFPVVARDGVLPRKAFSLGEAEEKRFYLEARRLQEGA
ncbi:MAG TPA: DUF1015 domain-containing protein [Myxococcota bacterium]|nr:DUF1015 domain-containing protein [Myxococcota bacterium]